MSRFRSFLVYLSSSLTVLAMSLAPALADATGLTKVESFAQSVIQVLLTLAGLLAVIFFVLGGISYIGSSGNPEKLERAKNTIIYSAIGLAVAIAAFVVTDIVTQLATTAFK